MEKRDRNCLLPELSRKVCARTRVNEALMADAAGSARRANERSGHYYPRTMNINQLIYLHEEKGNQIPRWKRSTLFNGLTNIGGGCGTDVN